MNIKDKVDKKTIQFAKDSRLMSKNDSDPDDIFDDADVVFQSLSQSSPEGYGRPPIIGPGLNEPPPSNFNNFLNVQGMSGYGHQQPQELREGKRGEDILFEGLGKSGVFLKDASLDLLAGVKEMDALDKTRFALFVRRYGVITGCVLGILCVFLAIPFTRWWWELGCDFFLATAILFGWSQQMIYLYNDEADKIVADLDNEDFVEDFEDDIYESDQQGYDSEPEIDLFGDDEDDYEEPVYEEKEEVEEVDINKATLALENESENKMMTRAYLYEKFTSVLGNQTKGFTTEKTIPEDSDDFFAWDAILKQGSESIKGASDDFPDLESAKDKLFYVLLEFTRPKWLSSSNVSKLVEEVISVCSYDPKTNKRNTKIHGHADIVGSFVYMKIYKGESAMISLKDIMEHDKEFFLNSSHLIPVTLGVDSEGLPYNIDLKDMNSLIVSGMPRSGKTWFLLSLFSQMMFFNRPEDLHFYFLDPKDEISDFRDVKSPHVKAFKTSDEDILNQLRKIVKEEGVRRTKILGDANEVNIWDFKKKNPDVAMPLIYVVIDEVITLAQRMSKEVKEEFQGLLLELTTRLPALGIRIIMVPHLVKNDILRKSITDVIPCKISVCGDSEHIASITGDKKFAFPLENIGDMAVKITGESKAMFIHGPVIASTNKEVKQVLTYIDKFWRMQGYGTTLENNPVKELPVKKTSFTPDDSLVDFFDNDDSDLITSVDPDEELSSKDGVNTVVEDDEDDLFGDLLIGLHDDIDTP
jgi:DNA segregation ATPase FtsK/SpoIIIE-like protein